MADKIGISLSADIAAFKKGLDDAVKVAQGSHKKINDVQNAQAQSTQKTFEKIAQSVAGSEKQVGRSLKEVTSIIQEQKTITLEFERELAALQSKKQDTSQTNLAAQKQLRDKINNVKDAIKDQKLAVRELEHERQSLTKQSQGHYQGLNQAIQGGNQLLGGATLALGSFGVQGSAASSIIGRIQDGLQIVQGMNTFGKMEAGIGGAQGGLKGLVKGLGGMKTIIGGLGIGLIITAFYALADAVMDADAEIDEANKSLQKTIDLRQEFVDKVTKLNKAQERIEIAKAKQSGATEEEIYQIKVKWFNKNYDLQESQVLDEGKLWDMAAEGEEMKAEHTEKVNAESLRKQQDYLRKRKEAEEEALRLEEERIKKAVLLRIRSEHGVEGQSTRRGINGSVPIIVGDSIRAANALKLGMEGVNQQITLTGPSALRLAKDLDAVKVKMQDVTISGKDMAQALESSMESLAAGLGEALGGALAGEAVSFGDVILKSMADFMSTIGKAIIATAIAVKAFRDQIIANPLAAVAAGVALVAGAAFINAKLKEGPQKYAMGGIVPGASNTGDRIPALVNSGEMILNKNQQGNLFKMISAGGSQASGERLVAIVKGNDLLFVLQQAERGKRRG